MVCTLYGPKRPNICGPVLLSLNRNFFIDLRKLYWERSQESLLKKLPRLEPPSRDKTEKKPTTSGRGIEEAPSLLLELKFGSNWFGSLLDISEFKPVPLRGITTAHATVLQYSPVHKHGIYQCPSIIFLGAGRAHIWQLRTPLWALSSPSCLSSVSWHLLKFHLHS